MLARVVAITYEEVLRQMNGAFSFQVSTTLETVRFGGALKST